MNESNIENFLHNKKVEDFSSETLDEWRVKKTDTIAKYKKAENDINLVKQEIEAANSKVTDLEKVKREISKARENRKKFIALGKSTKTIEGNLSELFAKARALEDDIELAKDMVEALIEKEQGLHTLRKEIKAEIEKISTEIGLIELCIAAKEYNEKAAALAPAVKVFNDLLEPYPFKNIRRWLPRLGDPYGDWKNTSLGQIPALRLSWPKCPGNYCRSAPVDEKKAGVVYFYKAKGT